MHSERTRILLVEDNPDDEVLALRALKLNNYIENIDVTRDGVEALDYLFARGNYEARKGKPLPHLVLLDLKLPRINGIEVLQEISKHETTRMMPVVVLTSSGEQQDILNSYRYGANSYIRKEVDFEKFTEAMKTLGKYWLKLNEPPPV